MNKYFTTKLTELVRRIESLKNQIIQKANDLDIKAIISLTEELSIVNNSYRSFTKDAVNNLTVDEIVVLFEAKLIEEYSTEYALKYDRYVTLAERDRLTKLSYKFRDARVK